VSAIAIKVVYGRATKFPKYGVCGKDTRRDHCYRDRDFLGAPSMPSQGLRYPRGRVGELVPRDRRGTESAIVERNAVRYLVSCCALLLCLRAVHAQSPLPSFPEPEKVIKSDKQFNAVTLGPGNTFSIQAAPPDLELEAFDFSSDEKLLFTEWGSGRLETRDLDRGKRVSEFKPVSGPLFEVADDNYDIQKVLLAPDGSWLAYVNGQHATARSGAARGHHHPCSFIR
jgi:hypothetical protein